MSKPKIHERATFSTSPYFFDRGGHGTAEPITERVNPHLRPIVSYYAPREVGSHHYGERHPMKPHRLQLTNSLVMGYGLDKQIHYIYDPPPASKEDLMAYHDPDYIEFLSNVSTIKPDDLRKQLDSFNCSEDCPVFADVYDFCRLYTGGSLGGARKLCAQTTDIAINWSGGLHHAKRGEASGFCYINDVVLAILELLRWHPRVLYIDIDIHHGDGVEFAFYETPRVMTVSFYKYNGEFFPCTGKLDDTGSASGKNYCVNVPLQDGIDDESYLLVFKSVINDVVDTYRPSAIVLQCGADSLGCDRLGAFNLSIAGHGECVNHIRKYGVPLLVVGGGGYTIKNVSRCWTYETSVLVGVEIPNELPSTVYDAFFADSQWKLHPPPTSKMDNMNSKASLAHIMMSVKKQTRRLNGAPSVAMSEIPPGARLPELDEIADRRRREEEEAIDKKPTMMGAIPRNEHYTNDKDHDMWGSSKIDVVEAPNKAPHTIASSTSSSGARTTSTKRGQSSSSAAKKASDAASARKAKEAPAAKKAKSASTSASASASLNTSDGTGSNNILATPAVTATSTATSTIASTLASTYTSTPASTLTPNFTSATATPTTATTTTTTSARKASSNRSSRGKIVVRRAARKKADF